MSRELAEAHIEAERLLRKTAVAAITAAWRALPGHNEADLPGWLLTSTPIALAAQRQSVALTEAYLARVLERQPFGLPADDLIGAGVRNGAPPEEVYKRPFVTLWGRLGAGANFADASAAALARAQGTVAMDVQLSMRATANAAQEVETIYGYQRVADAGACTFCQEVDGAYVKSADAMPLHNNCGCGLEPLTESHPLAVFLPDGTRIRNYRHGPLINTPPPDTVAIHEHGELGPVLGDPSHDFTQL